MMSVRSTLLLLSCAALLSGTSAAPSDTKLRQLLLQRSLLAPLRGQEDPSGSALLQLLAEFLQAENEALGTDAQDDAHAELERAAGPLLAPRERKAGCKNFFWKTFTSC